MNVPSRILLSMLVLLLASAASVFSGCGSNGGETTAIEPADAVDRQVAPVFSGTLTDGTAVSLESYAGRPLLLAFWASW